MFIVSSRVSWVIIGVSEKMVVGEYVLDTRWTPDRQDWCARGGDGSGRGVTENVIGMMLEKRRK